MDFNLPSFFTNNPGNAMSPNFFTAKVSYYMVFGSEERGVWQPSATCTCPLISMMICMH